MTPSFTGWGAVLSAWTLVFAPGCGPREAAPLSEAEPAARGARALTGTNGLTLNGLTINGLALNGLALNGLSSPAFIQWFDSDPAVHDEVMKYIVYCAANWGDSRAFTSPSTGRTHTWNGWLGLANNWAAGSPATEAEQQLISACLAAHVNTYGLHVQFSVLGEKGAGKTLYVAKGELEEFNTREACFFGNLFTGEGVYVGNDRNSLRASQSTPRRCGLAHVQTGSDPGCGDMVRVGACEQLDCGLERNANYYRTCRYNGTEYRVLTSRLRAADVYTCGDGVCQVSERCGTGQTALDCGLDCGPCG